MKVSIVSKKAIERKEKCISYKDSGQVSKKFLPFSLYKDTSTTLGNPDPLLV